jgi:hypothetical protein
VSLAADEALRIRLAVQDRLVDYWWDVDRDGARGALDYYTADCLYDMCGHRMQGHGPIRDYYGFRASRGERLVRHVLTNVRVRVHAPDRAVLDGILTVSAADGVPVLPSAPPILLADTRCEFVLGSDGAWRMREHHIIALFRGGVPVLVPPAS